MIIDFHTHAADLRVPGEMNRKPVTLDNQIQRMDEEGIDRAVLMPVNVSPEMNPPMTDFGPYLSRFREMGCVGIGEITANLPVDDSRVINMFRQCGDWDMPVLFHCTGPGQGVYGLYDDVGLPGLEKLLISSPQTIIIGHAPGFWSEISGNITAESKFIYPTGPIRSEGALHRLLRKYPNLYADISALSGFHAISRDKAFGIAFLRDFQDQILFGTDVCFADRESRMPHLSYLKNLLAEGLISSEVFTKITCDNAGRILKLF